MGRRLGVVLAGALAGLATAAPASALQPIGTFLERADAQNPDNREALATVAQRNAEATVAFRRLLPAFTARGTYTHNQYEVVFALPGTTQAITLVPGNQFDAVFQLDVPIFDPAGYGRYRAASAQASATQASQVLTRLGVQQQVVNIYNQIIGAEALVASSEAKRGGRATQRHGGARSAHGGAGLRLRRAARHRQRRARAARSRRRRAHREPRAPQPGDADGDRSLPSETPLEDDLHEEAPLAQWLSTPGASLPSGRAAAAATRAAEAGRTSAKLALLPTITASAQERISNAASFGGQNANYTLTATATWRFDLSLLPAISAQDAAVAAARARREDVAQRRGRGVRRLAARPRRDRQEPRGARAGRSSSRRGEARRGSLRRRHRHAARGHRGAARRIHRRDAARDGRRRPGRVALAPSYQRRPTHGRNRPEEPVSTTMMSKRAASMLLLALAAAPAGCKAKASAAVSTEEAVRPAHVETAEVREQAMPRSLSLTGTLRGERQTDLAANANGRVLETLVERGAEVKKGALIARLDVRAAALSAAEAQAQVALARAQEATATRECERSKALLAKGVISQVEFDKTSDLCRTSPLSVAAAAARVSSASQGIGDGQIRAPFDGMISERFVDVGEYVRQDSKVVSLVAIDTLRIEFTVPEASLASVKEGGTLTFTVTAYPGRSFTGTVRFISAAVRETTRDLVAEARWTTPIARCAPACSPRSRSRPGRCRARWWRRTRSSARTGARVYAVVDHRLEERVVQTGVEKDGVIAIVRGVRAGTSWCSNPPKLSRTARP